jgi:hypothetical protein
MQRFRAFSSADCNDDLAALERAINEWLETDHPHIHYFAQSAFGEHLIVSFVYAQMPAETAVAAAEAAVQEVYGRTLEDIDLDPTVSPSGGHRRLPLPTVELPY